MPDISGLRELYERADCFAREVGETRYEVPIPAHNELRYAGHHLLQSLDDDGTADDEEQLRKARNHCERAMYEAAEAGIMHVLEAIGEFQRAYKSIVVSEVVPDYRERIRRVRAAQKFIVRGRADRGSIDEHASDIMRIFRDLNDSLEVLDASRDDLNAKKKAEDEARRRDARNFAFTVLGIVVGLLGIVATLAVS